MEWDEVGAQIAVAAVSKIHFLILPQCFRDQIKNYPHGSLGIIQVLCIIGNEEVYALANDP
ncbi:MAG: hypothetical protein C5B44_06225 [Acidobacteria bacterium]|nr:MAG: hypothetical protein C5B44_06225 [Acidobacteriota bacterium]